MNRSNPRPGSPLFIGAGGTTSSVTDIFLNRINSSLSYADLGRVGGGRWSSNPLLMFLSRCGTRDCHLPARRKREREKIHLSERVIKNGLHNSRLKTARMCANHKSRPISTDFWVNFVGSGANIRSVLTILTG